jgi:flagellar hook-basal body complex protein FliE
MQWGIESLAAIAGQQSAAAVTSTVPVAAAPGAGAYDTFAAVMERELGQVNASVGAAETAMRHLASGKPVELHEVMISLERARLSVQTFVQVRNKLVESYQELLRMQL